MTCPYPALLYIRSKTPGNPPADGLKQECAVFLTCSHGACRGGRIICTTLPWGRR